MKKENIFVNLEDFDDYLLEWLVYEVKRDMRYNELDIGVMNKAEQVGFLRKFGDSSSVEFFA